MMIFIIIALIMVLIAALDVPYMLKNKLKKELWITSTLMLLGTCLSVALSMDIPIPNPFEGMKFVYKPISDLFYTWLS